MRRQAWLLALAVRLRLEIAGEALWALLSEAWQRLFDWLLRWLARFCGGFE
ncbi:hypothetical protein [Methylomonas sp. HYX-M1]|uniref:hypothetical protein n=1 Tax=Methylomonas sp. HYX-M1 TaxID=3139307 RepID=UPI00345B5A6D